jgi:hypothetical protein
LFDFLSNSLGALVGTFSAFSLGVWYDRHKQKTQHQAQFQYYAQVISDCLLFLNEETFQAAYHATNAKSVENTFNKVIEKFKELDNLQSSFRRICITEPTLLKEQRLEELNITWFKALRASEKFENAHRYYQSDLKAENADEKALGKKLNQAHTNFLKPIKEYEQYFEEIKHLNKQ